MTRFAKTLSTKAQPAEPAGRSDRREFLGQFATGLGGVALASLLGRDGLLRADALPGEAADLPPHHPPKARRVIQIFLSGGLSQVDSFDFKPALAKYHGQPLPSDESPDVFFGQVGLLHKNHWEFKQRGQSGLWISELFPQLAECADQLTVIRSMVASSGNHTPAIYEAHSGFRLTGFPVMGSWLSYGLGCETDDLPAFVVLPDPRGLPTGGTNNWTNGFLPARHQGVAFRGQGAPIADLQPAAGEPENLRLARYNLLSEMNRSHLARSAASDPLSARIHAYEMAARMQTAVPKALDLAQETAETQTLYGLDQPTSAPFGRNCLLARRLIERGVRLVQMWSGDGPKWDSHGNVPGDHAAEASRIDRPIAGLLQDLKRRGLLDDTLVVFNTEFGRTPFAQSSAGTLGVGRDHNQTAFSVWLAGAGLKPGIAHGSTDEFGYRVAQNPVSVHDFHATILHLLGIDHERLTYYHNGIQRRLTNVHGQVVKDLLA